MSDFGDLRVSDSLIVPAWELSEAFVRASGPGGQHVNKVSTAVQLTWQVEASSLPAEVKARFVKLFGSRMTNDGRLILEASSHRSQVLNREAARKRLAEMILKASHKPKRRIRTKPTKGSIRRRIAAKKHRGEIKSLRGNVDRTDD
ncbi:MAG TPA: aminoacyl-tRNA hydrolase [Hyphomonas adhaerens]|uniref:Aminoacyl-tRNA hydrolase n=1 Tax=Hyphomonas adhaerens TaxID=81029 RepID=A0A3B9GZR7_9PROT|nr:alternative ribosome rescue aminoacyl-tRNA hydrolase ArfB [Hyphomonas sp.]MBB40285.1 aminoacyl-tRNA hydrolase [Hyphomonas sp.]HAE27494.1 aminoacyl-tRNA hydrolase [Hyphomonas adhaerens]|tara:strand:+ start:6714 stop:7151 length:438 start_codon:yes stop_codon:yes gene_type:complete